MKINKYHFRTGQGTARIVFDTDSNTWHLLFMDEDSGAYHSPSALLDDVAGGHTSFAPIIGNFFMTRLPPDLDDWSLE